MSEHLTLPLTTSLTGYSLWAKDIVFVVSDGYLDGMHAWLAAYHGSSQSSGSGWYNLEKKNSLHVQIYTRNA